MPEERAVGFTGFFSIDANGGRNRGSSPKPSERESPGSRARERSRQGVFVRCGGPFVTAAIVGCVVGRGMFVAGSGSSAATAAALEIAEKAGGEDGPWGKLGDGLARVREQASLRRGADLVVVWYAGRPASKDHPFLAFRSSKSFERWSRDVVLVELSPEELGRPYPLEPAVPGARNEPLVPVAPKKPPTIGRRLRLIGSAPAVVVLDVAERVVLRIDGTRSFPSDKSLRRELDRVRGASKVYRAQRPVVVDLLTRSEDAFRRGKVRDAVKLVASYHSPATRAPLDADLRSRVESVLEDYRSRAARELDAARAKVDRAKQNPADSASELTRAIRTYDEITVRYPLPDVAKVARREKADLVAYVRELSVPGPGRPRP